VAIFADDGHRAGVLRTVPASAFTVVIGGIRIETGTAVVGIAFAGRFGFGCFFGFCFQCLLLPGFGAGTLTCRCATSLPPGCQTAFPRCRSARLASKLPFFRRPGFSRCLLPGFALWIARVGVGAASGQRQNDEAYDRQNSNSHSSFLRLKGFAKRSIWPTDGA